MSSLRGTTRKRLRDLSGKWKIVDMPDLDEDYLMESKNPHLNLTFRGRSVSGHYEYGLCQGELDGEVIEKGEDGKGLEIRFSFEGSDEMDEVNGYGEAVFSDDNKTLIGKFHYHFGDDWRFTCGRSHR